MLHLAFTKNIDEVERVTYETLIDLLGIDRGSLAFVESGVLNHRYKWKMENPTAEKMPLNGPGITVRAVISGISQLVDDVTLEPDYVSHVKYRNLVTRSELAVPVKVDDEVIAVINLESTDPSAFTEDDKKLVEIFSEHVASAISRLRRIKRLEIAFREKEEAEIELLDYNQRLNELVEEKTRELIGAEKAVIAGRFASMLGHDLRAPIRAISSAVQLWRETSNNSEKWIDMIQQSAERADEMIDTFRDSIRDSSIQPYVVNFCEILKSAVEEVSLADFLKVEFECGSGLDAVVIDGPKIRRVLDNLISNATQAMSDGGLLRLPAEVMGEEILFVVSDSGVGISNDELSNLFTPFHTTKEEGLGLGLAYCKRVVNAHGGSISVESTVDVGSSFTVRIPVCSQSTSGTEMPIASETHNISVETGRI